MCQPALLLYNVVYKEMENGVDYDVCDDNHRDACELVHKEVYSQESQRKTKYRYQRGMRRQS